MGGLPREDGPRPGLHGRVRGVGRGHRHASKTTAEQPAHAAAAAARGGARRRGRAAQERRAGATTTSGGVAGGGIHSPQKPEGPVVIRHDDRGPGFVARRALAATGGGGGGGRSRQSNSAEARDPQAPVREPTFQRQRRLGPRGPRAAERTTGGAGAVTAGAGRPGARGHEQQPRFRKVQAGARGEEARAASPEEARGAEHGGRLRRPRRSELRGAAASKGQEAPESPSSADRR